MNAAEDARLGLTVICAMDMHELAPGNLAPTLDARLTADWQLRGYLVGEDIFRASHGPLLPVTERVCYGLLLESTTRPDEFVVAVRGTYGLLEWAEDGEFASCPHPLGGHVECGFWGVYERLRLRLPDGSEKTPMSGIADVVGAGMVTVVGHSLGAALATYLTLDLAEIPKLRVRGRFFASPRPGDTDFAKLFDSTVADYLAYAYALDVVPHVPFGLGYTPLPKLLTLTPANAQARIGFGPQCAHHLVGYLAMIDYALTDWAHMPAIDQSNASCIKGPTVSASTP